MSVEKGTIFAFVVPVLVIILVILLAVCETCGLANAAHMQNILQLTLSYSADHLAVAESGTCLLDFSILVMTTAKLFILLYQTIGIDSMYIGMSQTHNMCNT